MSRGALEGEGEDLVLTEKGRVLLAEIGIDPEIKVKGRRKLCRPCLDWSMRRPHLAGALGAAIWERIQELGWARRMADSRVIRFTAKGSGDFSRFLGR